jgi:hypothetical protein
VYCTVALPPTVAKANCLKYILRSPSLLHFLPDTVSLPSCFGPDYFATHPYPFFHPNDSSLAARIPLQTELYLEPQPFAPSLYSLVLSFVQTIFYKYKIFLLLIKTPKIIHAAKRRVTFEKA